MAKDGELKVSWRKFEGEYDIVYDGGEGTSRADRSYLHSVLGTKREVRTFTGTILEPSVLEELEARGYDLTTLRFSIKKK